MLIAETCLLLAVRDRLRTYMGLDERQCDIELDDQVPTLAREKYFTVTSAGTTPGPFHATAAGSWDLQFAVKVTLYQERLRSRAIEDAICSSIAWRASIPN